MRNVLCGAVFIFVCGGVAQQNPAKQLKEGEVEPYNEVLKDINGGDFAKAVQDLDAWALKYPDSAYKDDRTAFYVQAYAATNQAAKSVDTAAGLLSKDLNAAFPDPGEQAIVIRLLDSAVWAISHLPGPTADELATGAKAAHQLMDYDKQLPGVTAAKWAEARADMKEKANAALLYIAMLPGIQAMAKQPPDCAAAEQAYTAALGDFPNKSAVSYELGRALYCEAKEKPEKRFPAIYEFVRAATIDPTLGDPRTDPKKIQAVGDTAYIKLHGSAEGLDQVKQQVKQSPLPPADFNIKTSDEIAAEKQAEFEKANPELALWAKIKAALSDANAEQYFASQMKDSLAPQLMGRLIEAKPACRSKELLVAVPLPDSAGKPEIRLKLDRALTGSPEINADFRWEGVLSAFTKDPFLLTMETETGKLQGLKMKPCAAPARRNPATKTRASEPEIGGRGR
jgi:hypothetical protein